MPQHAPTGRIHDGDTAAIRVVVADAHDGFRHALRTVLDADARLVVVAEARDLAHAGTAIRRDRADALVTDVNLLEAGPRRLGPIPAGTAVVAVGMDDSAARERAALRRGADAYVVKDRAHTGLVEAVVVGVSRLSG